MKIRPATLADLPRLMALEAHFPSDRMTTRAWRRFLRSPTAVAMVAIEPAGAELTDPEIDQDQVAQDSVKELGGEGAIRAAQIARH